MGENVKQIDRYSMGPFDVEVSAKRVTLQPGVYRLTKPVTFGILEETEIIGAVCAPLDGD